ncbi:MAG TPA: nickel-responsive transcriptional regulator NikR [Candidatus Acidoferrales bacterium]
MPNLIRTGISLDKELLDKFDRIIDRKGYGNRSEAIRDLVRDCVVEEDIEQNRMAVGTLTLVYDHHKAGLSNRLTSLQHDMHGQVLAATHVHLDHHNCLEVIIMKGRSFEMKSFADKILSLRGVKHGKFVLTTTAKDLP